MADTTPIIEVQSDFDGYFKRLVEDWVGRKFEDGAQFKHKKIVITAGPYRSAAVSFKSEGDTITLDFYSALRTGFGHLSDADVTKLIAKL